MQTLRIVFCPAISERNKGMTHIPRVRLRKRNIEIALAKMNKSQNWLSFKLMVSSGYLSQYMAGQRNASPKIRERIAKILNGYDWEYLFEMVDK